MKGEGAGYDWAEWNRMHYGPSEAERKAYYEQVMAAGGRGPWEDPAMSDRFNAGTREWARTRASRGLSETEHYREYAERCVPSVCVRPLCV